MGQYYSKTESHAIDDGKPTEQENIGSINPDVTDASKVAKFIVKESLEAPPSKSCIQARVHKLTGGETRQIVLAVCAESCSLKNHITELVERREGEVDLDEGRSLGMRLQALSRTDVAALILYILEFDAADPTDQIIKQMVNCFEQQKKLRDDLS